MFVLRISLKWKVVDYFQLMSESPFLKNDIPRDNMERKSRTYSLYPLIPGEKPRKLNFLALRANLERLDDNVKHMRDNKKI